MDGSKNSSLPQILGDMCDRMWLRSQGSLNDTVCQGFAYDTQTEMFTFFGHSQNQPIVLTQQNTCNRPTSLLWVLNAGMLSGPPFPAPLALCPVLSHCSLICISLLLNPTCQQYFADSSSYPAWSCTMSSCRLVECARHLRTFEGQN